MSNPISTAEAAAEWAAIEDLQPWDKNPRKNEAAVAEVAKSIERFGFGAPILARQATRTIIAGHTWLRAAKTLGLTRVPVRFLDISEQDAELLALADNKLGEIAEWDEAQLGAVLEDLKADGADLSFSGFSQKEVDGLLADLAAARLGDVEEQAVPEPPEHAESVTSEIYELGPHRLLCGDSTDPATLILAMGGTQADLLFTDPPYGVAYHSHMAEGGTASRFRPIENDNLKPEALAAFLAAAISNAASVLRPGAAVYVCHADQKPGIRPAFEAALIAADIHIAGCIAWVKPAATMGWQDYRNQYEPILYGWKNGAERRKVEDRTQTTVWEITRDAAGSYVHPTQKPVELPERAIRNSTVAGEIVLDLFGGSGSTLIAATKTGRKAVLVEKDPRYCDVIRKRWANWQDTTKAG